MKLSKSRVACPRVEWDSEARAVYLRVIDRWPEVHYQKDFHGDGSLILDLAYDLSVLGAEMLSVPIGPNTESLVSARYWVLIGRAWERGSALFKGTTSGCFPL